MVNILGFKGHMVSVAWAQLQAAHCVKPTVGHLSLEAMPLRGPSPLPVGSAGLRDFLGAQDKPVSPDCHCHQVGTPW